MFPFGKRKKRTFPGGIHPGDFKDLTKGIPIRRAPLPSEVILPVVQHIGAPAQIIVQKGDLVRKGQIIAEAGGFVSAPVHASISGTVKLVEPRPHCFGRDIMSVIIESDGQDAWVDGLPVDNDIEKLSPEEIKEKVQQAGIVGLGGAAFPAHVKLSPPPGKKIDTVIVNAAECEPFLTCDYRLMIERTADIVAGLRLLMRASGASRGFIGVEENKSDAFELLAKAAAPYSEIEPVLLETRYPQGGELMLIEAVLGKQVPAGMLPMEVGAHVQNVGSTVAIYEACRYNKPLIERGLTLTGPGAGKPANLVVRLGTPVADLLKLGEASPEMRKLVLGGPMMGLAQYTSEIAVVKGTSGVLLLTQADDDEYGHCIRCGRCVRACPMRLVPSDLGIICEAGRVDEMIENNIMDCKECGSCTYVCPSRRPIVQWVRRGKAELARRKAKQAAT